MLRGFRALMGCLRVISWLNCTGTWSQGVDKCAGLGSRARYCAPSFYCRATSADHVTSVDQVLIQLWRLQCRCPYYLARHMIAFANVVVYNYQYMLDPKVLCNPGCRCLALMILLVALSSVHTTAVQADWELSLARHRLQVLSSA